MTSIINPIYHLFTGTLMGMFFPKVKRKNYWQRFGLRDLTPAEWEDLCDGCGKCCLFKFDSYDESKVEFTNVACRLLDCSTCQCKHYEERKNIVHDCVKITPELLEERSYWLPSTCAYRLLHENKQLHDWHHLVSGDRNTVHEQGISVRNWVISETEVSEHDIQNHIVEVQEK